MATCAVMLVRVPWKIDDSDLSMLRGRIVRDFAAEDVAFYEEGPLERIVGEPRRLLPAARGSSDTWLDLNCHMTYYGQGYERGNLPLIVQIAEWLERALPGCDIWYGHDVGDDTVWPFGATERTAMLEYFRKVGHAPYEGGFHR